MPHTQKIYITHVQQAHLPPFATDISPQEFEEIAFSQFNVAQTIIAHPKALVVKEGLYANYTPELVPLNQNAQLVKQVFPDGLPNAFTDLNPRQKNYLAKRGGEVTLFDLGILSHVYQSISYSEDQAISTLIAKNCFDAIYEPRDLLAIKYSIIAAKNSAKEEVTILLIMGGIHDIEKSISLLPDNSTVFFNGAIDTTMVNEKNKLLNPETSVQALQTASANAASMTGPASMAVSANTAVPASIEFTNFLSEFKSNFFNQIKRDIAVANIPSEQDELPQSGNRLEKEGVECLKKLALSINLKILR